MSDESFSSPYQKIAKIFHILGNASQVEILLAIGTGEACVCHLEAATGWRQAYISQQLMILRSEGIVVARREGRNIFYRLKQPNILDLILEVAQIAGVREDEIALHRWIDPLQNCKCPYCRIQGKNSL